MLQFRDAFGVEIAQTINPPLVNGALLLPLRKPLDLLLPHCFSIGVFSQGRPVQLAKLEIESRDFRRIANRTLHFFRRLAAVVAGCERPFDFHVIGDKFLAIPLVPDDDRVFAIGTIHPARYKLAVFNGDSVIRISEDGELERVWTSNRIESIEGVLHDGPILATHVNGVNIRPCGSGHAGRPNDHRFFLTVSEKIEVFEMIDCDLVETLAVGMFIDELFDLFFADVAGAILLCAGNRSEAEDGKEALW